MGKLHIPTVQEMILCSTSFLFYGPSHESYSLCHERILTIPYSLYKFWPSKTQAMIDWAHTIGSKVNFAYFNEAKESVNLQKTQVDGLLTESIEVLGPLLKKQNNTINRPR